MQHILVTKDNGYVLFVVLIIPSFPHYLLLTKITRRLPLLGQELFSILKHLISPHNGYGYKNIIFLLYRSHFM